MATQLFFLGKYSRGGPYCVKYIKIVLKKTVQKERKEVRTDLQEAGKK